MFQSFNLIDELNVFENVELPLTYLKVKAGERKQMVNDILKRMNISHRAGHFPQQLSGGQQQRHGDSLQARCQFRPPDHQSVRRKHRLVGERVYLRCRRKNRKPFDFFSNGFLYDFQNKIIPLEQSKFNRP